MSLNIFHNVLKYFHESIFNLFLHWYTFGCENVQNHAKVDKLETNTSQFICDEGPVFKFSNLSWTDISEKYNKSERNGILIFQENIKYLIEDEIKVYQVPAQSFYY